MLQLLIRLLWIWPGSPSECSVHGDTFIVTIISGQQTNSWSSTATTTITSSARYSFVFTLGNVSVKWVCGVNWDSVFIYQLTKLYVSINKLLILNPHSTQCHWPCTLEWGCSVGPCMLIHLSLVSDSFCGFQVLYLRQFQRTLYIDMYVHHLKRRRDDFVNVAELIHCPSAMVPFLSSVVADMTLYG